MDLFDLEEELEGRDVVGVEEFIQIVAQAKNYFKQHYPDEYYYS